MVLLTLVACAGPTPADSDTGTPPPTFDAELAASLDAALDGVPDATLPGFGSALHLADQGRHISGHGLVDVESGEAASADAVFRIGSVTKPIIATVVLLLVQDGLVDLNDPVSTWFAAVPNASEITVRHLLTHTSGLTDYARDPFYDDRSQPHTTAEVLTVIESLPPTLAPGTGELYSNSNFFLLGLVIEEVTDQALPDVLRERIGTPLGMSATWFEHIEPAAGTMSRGYSNAAGATGPEHDVTDRLDQSNTFSAGGLAAPPGDILTWAVALMEGDLLSDESRTAMWTPATLADGTATVAGLGIAVGQDPELGLVLNHTGGVDGFTANLFLFPDLGIAYVSAQNNDQTDPKRPFRAIADQVLP